MCKSHDSAWDAEASSVHHAWEADAASSATAKVKAAATAAQTTFHNWHWSQHCNKHAQQNRRLEAIVRVQQWTHLDNANKSSLSAAKKVEASKEKALTKATSAHKKAASAYKKSAKTASTSKKDASTDKKTTATKLADMVAANKKKCGSDTVAPTADELKNAACKDAHTAWTKAKSAEKKANTKASTDKKTASTDKKTLSSKKTALDTATTAHTNAADHVAHLTTRDAQNVTFKGKWANYSKWADASLKWTESDQDAVTDNKYGLNNDKYHPVESDASDLQAANKSWVHTHTVA